MTVAEKRHKGTVGYLAGAAAEESVAQDYERRGYPIVNRRWRGRAGEVDLIARNGDGLIFIEVKKGRSFDSAMSHLSERQMARLLAAAEEYIGSEPRGSLTDVRFDVALMDTHGQTRILENALGF